MAKPQRTQPTGLPAASQYVQPIERADESTVGGQGRFAGDAPGNIVTAQQARSIESGRGSGAPSRANPAGVKLAVPLGEDRALPL